MPYRESHNFMSAFDLATQQMNLAGQNGYPDTLSDAFYKGFGPRFGFAYSPFNDSSTVARGGYGMFFLPNSAIGGAPFTSGPWAQNLAYNTPDGVNFPIKLAPASRPWT